MNTNVLIDPFGRRISYLRISVTDRCNLRCAYCKPLEALQPRENLLRLEEIAEIAKVAVRLGISKVRITGGEPLVRKGIESLINMLSKIPGIDDLSLTTNGILLKKYAKALQAAGLMRINVSLDTLRDDRFRRLCGADSARDVFEGLELAQKIGLTPLKINTVLIKGFNDDEVPDFVRLAGGKGWKLRFIELMPFGNLPDKNFVSVEEIFKKIVETMTLKPLPSDGGVARRYMAGQNTEIGVITPLSNTFCGNCNRLRLTASGKLRTCLLNDIEVDLVSRVRGRNMEDAVAEGFFSAAMKKPMGHSIHTAGFRKCARPMNSIGG
ncbi:MAG TPA: GTP 3',8-cyclase MoaA [bacterium]